MEKVIVTGGAGFIGSHLVNELVKQGIKVTVLDNLSTGKKQNINPKAEFIECDIFKNTYGDLDFLLNASTILSPSCVFLSDVSSILI